MQPKKKRRIDPIHLSSYWLIDSSSSSSSHPLNDTLSLHLWNNHDFFLPISSLFTGIIWYKYNNNNNNKIIQTETYLKTFEGYLKILLLFNFCCNNEKKWSRMSKIHIFSPLVPAIYLFWFLFCFVFLSIFFLLFRYKKKKSINQSIYYCVDLKKMKSLSLYIFFSLSTHVKTIDDANLMFFVCFFVCFHFLIFLFVFFLLGENKMHNIHTHSHTHTQNSTSPPTKIDQHNLKFQVFIHYITYIFCWFFIVTKKKKKF